MQDQVGEISDCAIMAHKKKKSEVEVDTPPVEEPHGYEFFGPYVGVTMV